MDELNTTSTEEGENNNVKFAANAASGFGLERQIRRRCAPLQRLKEPLKKKKKTKKKKLGKNSK